MELATSSNVAPARRKPRKRTPTPRRVRIRMNVTECAAHCGVHSNTIRSWCHANKIPHIHLGGRFGFDRVAIDRWLASHTQAGE